MKKNEIAEPLEYLRKILEPEHFEKLTAINNPNLHKFVADSIALCKPDSVFVATDAPEDIDYLRRMAVKTGEEIPLEIEGHTVHFDGPKDQARDKANTRYLVARGEILGKNLHQIDYDEGLAEVKDYLSGIMTGKQVLVRFFCLGPTDSPFSISAVQLTDSFYVSHSEDLLYRTGYEQFKKLGKSNDFFRILHSAGRLDENSISMDVNKRRVYIDHKNDTVFSVNTQYGGNTIGFKKLALRLAIRKADREGWLAEHMFVMGAHGPGGRETYFTGAFPSGCGKTSTSMIEGETIIGDDLAYLRVIDGKVRAVNVESGIFGIIRDVNPENDPVIWKVLTSPGEVIFSNVLVNGKAPYWLGDGRTAPKNGINYHGEWYEGKTDEDGNEIKYSHKNARYTIRIKELSNRDKKADEPGGVPVGAIIYGGRDSDTSVPVTESFDWTHGVITMGASLESETTAATIGKEGVRAFQPMSNLDFVSISLGKYLANHLKFTKDVKQPPRIFAVNYFLKDERGEYLNSMNDKNVWIKWMERRCHDEMNAVKTPTGLIPRYEDLATLFREVLDREYSEKDYVRQFSMRIPQILDKIERIENIYRQQIADTPEIFFKTLSAQQKRLEELREVGGDVISPLEL